MSPKARTAIPRCPCHWPMLASAPLVRIRVTVAMECDKSCAVVSKQCLCTLRRALPSSQPGPVLLLDQQPSGYPATIWHHVMQLSARFSCEPVLVAASLHSLDDRNGRSHRPCNAGCDCNSGFIYALDGTTFCGYPNSTAKQTHRATGETNP